MTMQWRLIIQIPLVQEFDLRMRKLVGFPLYNGSQGYHKIKCFHNAMVYIKRMKTIDSPQCICLPVRICSWMIT